MIRGPAALAWAYARHYRGRTILISLCVTASVLVPLATHVLIRDFRQRLTQRADTTPLVAGATGNRFDLVMAAIYFRGAQLPPVTMADAESLRDAHAGVVIPLNARFTAQHWPVVATSVDYQNFRALSFRAGHWPTMAGEVALGSEVARALGLDAGGSLFSDQRELYNIAAQPALKLRISGVLQATGTPDDQAVFTDLATAWVLEGLMHGHADAATRVPETLVLERNAKQVTVSEELVNYFEVTPQNIGSFHLHGDQSTLPLTAIIIAPDSDRSGTLLTARINAHGKMQMIPPRQVVMELLGYVARIQELLTAISVLLAILTGVLIGLVSLLSAKVRARELATLARIGVAPRTITLMFACEIALVVIAGAAMAVVLTAILATTVPDLARHL